MKVGLYNLEPKYKNLALEKLRLYHQGRDDVVEDYFALKDYDKVYCSSIFDFTPKVGTIPPDAVCGGSGFSLVTELSPEIEAIKPRLNFGFTTRGCIRHCKFCVVPHKEGGIRAIGDLLDLWDSEAKDVILFDNNILALPEHFEKICRQASANDICLDFNQGLDHRLLTQRIVGMLKSIRHKEYRFAFDHKKMVDGVGEAIRLLQANGIKRCLWYVLVGHDSTIEDDLFRLEFLKDRNQNAFVQRFRDKSGKINKDLIPLAQWANQHHMFHAMTWEQFVSLPRNRQYKRLCREGREPS